MLFRITVFCIKIWWVQKKGRTFTKQNGKFILKGIYGESHFLHQSGEGDTKYANRAIVFTIALFFYNPFIDMFSKHATCPKKTNPESTKHKINLFLSVWQTSPLLSEDCLHTFSWTKVFRSDYAYSGYYLSDRGLSFITITIGKWSLIPP